MTNVVLQEYADVLARLQYLEHLFLPDTSVLALGFDGGCWCGNAYNGPQGRLYGRWVALQDAETAELAADIILSRTPTSKTLHIGRYQASITTDDLGEPTQPGPGLED